MKSQPHRSQPRRRRAGAVLPLAVAITICWGCANEATRLQAAHTAMESGKWEAACRTYQALVDSGSTTREAYLGLAKAQNQLGEEERAADAYRGWLSIDPTDREVHLLAGQWALKQGQRAEAASHFLTARAYSEYGEDIEEAEKWLAKVGP